MKKRISAIIKITDACNLRCKYCFYRKDAYSNLMLDKRHLLKFLKIIMLAYDYVDLSFHGGEPTYFGKDVFSEYVEIVKESAAKFNTKISLGLQTNGTMLNEEFVNFLKKEKINICFSYDWLSHDMFRNNTAKKVLAARKLLENKGMFFGCSMVVTKFNINNLVDNYKHFNNENIFVKLIPYCGERNKKFSVGIKEYITKMIELFDYWINDQYCSVILDPFERMIKDYFKGSSIMCANSFCAGKIISLEANGNIGFCAMKLPEEYIIKSVDEVETANAILGSQQFMALKKSALARSIKCRKNCTLYKYCKGGCNLNSYYENGIEEMGGFTCQAFKGIFNHVVDFIKNSTANPNNIEKVLNNRVRNLLLNYT